MEFFMKILFLSSVLFMSIYCDMLEFYNKSVDTLAYNKTYLLYEKSNKLAQKGLNYNKFANFSVDGVYTNIKAENFSDSFSLTDVSITDNFDIFSKASYDVEFLALELQAKSKLLNLQKEKLYVLLVDMIATYHTIIEKKNLHEKLLNEQENIYNKLRVLQNKGAISAIDLLRFKNTLTQLKMAIVREDTQVKKMKKQLSLYAPNQDIPSLDEQELKYTRDKYISNNMQLNINNINVDKLKAKSKRLENNYLPDISTSLAYQKNEEPGSYGDNYSLNIALSMPLSSGDFKQSEALMAKALSLKSKNIQYKIDRENEYERRYQDFVDATKELAILDENLKDYEKSEKTIKSAFLKQYVDFNTYLQVLTQSLHIKEHIIQMKYQKKSQASILNTLSSGVLYE
jgi:outer membrane protein TolC